MDPIATVWILMFCSATALAASVGLIVPELFDPSVMSMMMRDLVSLYSSRRVAALERAEPMAVPSSSWLLGSTVCSFFMRKSWSRVTAASRYDRPANETIPMRSYGRAAMKFWMVCLAASILVLPSYCGS